MSVQLTMTPTPSSKNYTFSHSDIKHVVPVLLVIISRLEKGAKPT